MAVKVTNTEHYTNIANAIRAKTGSQNTYTPAEMGPAIAALPTSKAAPEVNDVNLYDYYGALLYSYTAADFLALEEFPELPKHDGLTAQEWNWSLQAAKQYVSLYGFLEIGATYITSDGKTKLFIELTDVLTVDFSFRHSEAVEGVINWGDGETTPFNYNRSSTWQKVTIQHVYTAPGAYTIEIEISDNTLGFIIFGKDTRPGTSNTDHCELLTSQRPYLGGSLYNALKRVYIGNFVKLGASAFRYLTDLQAVTIPKNGLFQHAEQVMGDCYNIKHVTFPYCETEADISDGLYSAYTLKTVSFPESGVTGSKIGSTGGPLSDTAVSRITASGIGVASIGTAKTLTHAILPGITGITSYGTLKGLQKAVFPDALTLTTSGFINTALTEVIIPDTVSAIPGNCFSTCYQLAKIVIGAGVTSIGASAFGSCYGCREIHFKSSIPPTVSNSNAFTSLPTSCVIYVPEGTLADYTGATNYPNPANYTYREEGV